MGNIFHLILTQPLLNTLIWIYNILPFKDMGVAIIALTLLIRLVLLPSFHRQLKSQKELQQLQPKLNEIKEKYKNDQQQQSKAIMELYREHKVNPFSSCLPLLIQLPILIALYSVFLSGLKGDIGSELYPFIANPGDINTVFLGFVELSNPNLYFPNPSTVEIISPPLPSILLKGIIHAEIVKLSFAPYTFVGITDIKLVPYWRL